MRPPVPPKWRALAGVLFEVGALDADARAVGQVEEAVDVERLVVLADLVRLRHVGIEVVLAVERARLDRAVQGQADAHRQLDRLPVEHRQRAGQAERDRIDVGVRLVAEAVRRSREQLRRRRQLDVHLETRPPSSSARSGRPAVDRAIMTPRRLVARRLARRSSSSAAARNIVRLAQRAGASTCTPTGSPSAPVPNGTLIAGMAGEVGGDRVRCRTGTSPAGCRPSRRTGTRRSARSGVSSTSACSIRRGRSRRAIKRRTFSALP